MALGTNTDLIIIGGGAAGLMAAITAADLKLSCVILEKNNRPGRKLLMCGNNRCNLSTDLSPDGLLERYGDHNAPFLSKAIHGFTTRDLKNWFISRGLRVAVKESGRIYPKSEKANDVVNCFKDLLRDKEIPLILNTTVKGVERRGNLYAVSSKNITLHAPNVLIATGGVTYPKTGSVGDGQRFARTLGHNVLPYRPGLAAFDLNRSWWKDVRDLAIPEVALSIHGKGQAPITLKGGLELRQGLVHGPAAIDASNIISRLNLKTYSLSIDFLPNISVKSLQQSQDSSGNIKATLSRHLPAPVIQTLLKSCLNKCRSTSDYVNALKNAELPVKGMRPLKEAMVTVGGVSIDQIDANTMMSNRNPGLYFAGEVMDIEGPCGGFNLHAAFATARLAVQHIVDGKGVKKG